MDFCRDSEIGNEIGEVVKLFKILPGVKSVKFLIRPGVVGINVKLHTRGRWAFSAMLREFHSRFRFRHGISLVFAGNTVMGMATTKPAGLLASLRSLLERDPWWSLSLKADQTETLKRYQRALRSTYHIVMKSGLNLTMLIGQLAAFLPKEDEEE